jgi:hypothetical protein
MNRHEQKLTGMLKYATGFLFIIVLAKEVVAVDGLALYTRTGSGGSYTRQGNLYTAPLAESKLGEETLIDKNVLSAQFSPDMKRIGYVRLNSSNKEEIVVCSRDGSEKNVIKTDMAHPGDIRWCAFLCWRLQDKIIYSYLKRKNVYWIDPNTGEGGILYTAQVTFSKVSISQDGKHMTVRARDGYNGVYNIDLTNNQERRIASGCSNWISPDGNLMTHCPGGTSKFYVRDWAGKVVKTFNCSGVTHLMAWSHNSNEWVINQVGSGTLMRNWSCLWLHNATTGQSIRLTNQTSACETFRDLWVGAVPSLGPSVTLSSAKQSISINESVEITATPGGGFSGDLAWNVSGGGALSNTSNTNATFTSDGTEGTFTVTATGAGVEGTVAIKVADPGNIDLKINCGGTALSSWIDDGEFVANPPGDELTLSGAPDLSGVLSPAPADVYKSVRHGDHSYTIAVADGSYIVRIHFIEPKAGANRKMNYAIEGNNVLTDFNVETAAGGIYRAIAKQFNVTVSDGNGMQIAATKGFGDNVFEAGIEIISGNAIKTAFQRPIEKAVAAKTMRITRLHRNCFSIHIDREALHSLDIVRPDGTVVCSFAASSKAAYIWHARVAAGVYMIILRNGNYCEAAGPVAVY